MWTDSRELSRVDAEPIFIAPMPDPNHSPEPLSRYVVEREVERAETFATNNLNEGSGGPIPPSMLVVGEQRERLKILPFDLPEFTDPPSVWVAMLQERLAEIGAVVGQRRNFQPVCVVSMIEVSGLNLDSWVSELQERSMDCANPDYGNAIAITAANAEGYQLRRLCEIQEPSVSPTGQRLIVYTHDAQSLGEVSEMNAFWQTFQSVRRLTPGQGFGQLRMN